MSESRIKIRATVNEINKNFRECPSKYYYIRHYDGSKNYKENDDEPIVFEVLIRHNEIGKRSIERKNPYTFDSLEKTLTQKVTEYINEQILDVENKFAQINKISKNENISKIINNCALILDGIDFRNQNNVDGKKEDYPNWATKEVIELIEEWSYLNKKLNEEKFTHLQKDDETIDMNY